jgi:quercetin dioxygenase-like cupin family protein
MPKGEVMKLHNHPEMEVINYILRGKMEAKVYTPLLNNIYKKETHVLEPKHVSFIDGLLTKENNLH